MCVRRPTDLDILMSNALCWTAAAKTGYHVSLPQKKKKCLTLRLKHNQLLCLVPLSQPAFLPQMFYTCIVWWWSSTITIIELSVCLKHSVVYRNNKQLWALNYENLDSFCICIKYQIVCSSDKLGKALLSTSTWYRLNSFRQFHFKPL